MAHHTMRAPVKTGIVCLVSALRILVPDAKSLRMSSAVAPREWYEGLPSAAPRAIDIRTLETPLPKISFIFGVLNPRC